MDKTNEEMERAAEEFFATPKWRAVICYRTEGKVAVQLEHLFEEIEDLHDIVEQGRTFMRSSTSRSRSTAICSISR
jgi:hypothetical protein